MALYYFVGLSVLSFCLISGKAFVVGTTPVKLPSNCTLKDDSTCPKGYCCARDEFLFTESECKPFGKEKDSCTTRFSEYECPCLPDLECKSNIIGTGRPSLFGTCQPKPGLNTTMAPIVSSSGATVANATASDKVTLSPSSQDNTNKTTTSLPPKNSTTSVPHRTDKYNDPFTSPCSVTTWALRFHSCPPGTCCCEDPFMPNHPYCKPIGTEGSNCNAKEPGSLAYCGCGADLVCKPNVVAATYVSKYGTCQNSTR